jgi:hypothetical protein
MGDIDLNDLIKQDKTKRKDFSKGKVSTLILIKDCLQKRKRWQKIQ